MSVAIYMEGGGDGRDTKDALRRGMEVFLEPIKQAARDKAMRWKLVCCGPRNEAYRRFRNALQEEDHGVVVLLVDAEGPLVTDAGSHLHTRDGWDVTSIDDNLIHLMVQTMEAWIVADGSALRAYYGQHFNAGALPKAADLENVGKRDLETALRRATRHTQKGDYHKIRHASDLLRRMNAETVRARCAHCQRLFDDLAQLINAA